MTNVSSFFEEFLGTAILLFVIFAMLDKKNMPPPAGLNPLILFFLILAIGACIGMQTGQFVLQRRSNPLSDAHTFILTRF